MSRGMRVHEIFSSHNLQESKKNDLNLSGGLKSKKTFAPMPPMTKFGGYKPKILSDTNDIGPNINDRPMRSPPTSPARDRPRPILSKPKPFIIGDKDVPMVLSTVGDDTNGAEHGNVKDSSVNDTHVYASVDDADITAIRQAQSQIPLSPAIVNGFEHPDLDPPDYDNSDIDQNDKVELFNPEITTPTADDFAMENPAFTTAPEIFKNDETVGGREDVYSNGLHIPEPDYDEKEETLDFTEEDPDEVAEYNNSVPSPRQPKPQLHRLSSLSDRYDVGEDFSQYLSDDDDIMEMNSSNVRGKKQMASKLNQKYSIFKEPANNNNSQTFSKSKTKDKSKKSPSYNSVRNFSFADSKYGTKGKANGRSLALRNNKEGEDNFHDDSYESFLYSRHGHTMPSRISGVSNMEVDQWKGARTEEDKLWKKLTYRLKNKRNKSGYALRET